jgi:YVTN family beta-propeller protein
MTRCRLGLVAMAVGAGWACASPTDPPQPVPDTEVPAAAAIVITPGRLDLLQDSSAAVRVTVLDADGHEITGVHPTVTAADDGIANVSNLSVTGVGPGGTSVIATYGAVSGSVPIEVTGHPHRRSLRSVPLSGGPFATAVTRDGRIFVARHFTDLVTSAESATAPFDTHLAIGRDPTGLDVDRAGARLYVTKQFSGNVGVVDVEANALIDSIPVLGDPFIVAVAPDQQSLFVTTNANAVFRVTLATGTVTMFDSYSAPSNAVSFDPADSLVYISTIDGHVYEYALGTGARLRTFTAQGLFQGMVVAPRGDVLYVADESQRLVRAWDLRTGEALTPAPMNGGPFDLKLSPDEHQLWVSLSDAGSVAVLHRATLELVGTLPTGGTPRRIVFDRHGGVAVIGNEAGWVDIVR